MALLQVNIRNDDDFNCLMPDYKSILSRQTEIEANFKKTPAILGRFFSILTDFYIDRFKFKGIFVKDKIPELIQLLENYSYVEVLDYFTNIKQNETNTEQILQI